MGQYVMKKILLITSLIACNQATAGMFTGDSSGTFVDPTGSSSLVVTGVGTDHLTWGAGTPGELQYTGHAFDVDENSPFVFGTLDYFNGTTTSNSAADSVDLSVGLSFTSPSTGAENFIFDLGIINTTNTSDPQASADYVNFDNAVPDASITLNGVAYTLEFLGFGTLNGGGFTIDNSFRVLENDSASVDLIGRITLASGTSDDSDAEPEVSVPEPESILLLGMGLIALFGTRRFASKD